MGGYPLPEPACPARLWSDDIRAESSAVTFEGEQSRPLVSQLTRHGQGSTSKGCACILSSKSASTALAWPADYGRKLRDSARRVWVRLGRLREVERRSF